MAFALNTPAATITWLLDITEGDLWLDGGWGVDALIGHQTRDHDDVDIVVEQSVAKDLVDRLRSEGFVDVPRDDSRACNFVLGHQMRGLIDFHLVTWDAQGNGLYGIPDPEDVYPASAFSGRGYVSKRPVKCMSAGFQIENHNSGYPLRDKDFADMKRLSDALGIALPPELVKTTSNRLSGAKPYTRSSTR